MTQARWQFWIDRGGTFTDIVARRPDGRIVTHKLLSENPTRYRDAALAGMRALMGLPADAPLPAESIEVLRMGTTLGTNALLERKGARVALVTTRGFGDAVVIGYQNRPDIFALDIRRPPPLYERVIEVDERLRADGHVETPLDAEALAASLEAARREGIEAVAIVFLHGFRHPLHEKEAARLAREAGFRFVVASHEASPLIKFVARADTTLVDAYLTPRIADYVAGIRAELPKTRVLFMQSNGGLIDAADFRGRDCLLSGPAGGIIGAVAASRQAGFERIITFDMGGTSTDVALFDGEFERRFETELAGLRLRVPMLAIHTVAAGGGSILHFDGRRFAVGPDSAGAKPGPACYRNGGPLTVTDCNLLVGRIKATHFPRVFGPGGDQSLDHEEVRRLFDALAARVSEARGQVTSPEEVADGFLAVAVENMAEAIRRISLARGHDPREYTLCCYGGAGGQLVCRVADVLGIRRIFVHPLAGVLSAFGMGVADERIVLEEASGVILDPAAAARLGSALEALAQRARAMLIAHGAAENRIITLARLQLRYAGTETALPVNWGPLAAVREEFEAAYRRLYGFIEPDTPIEVEALLVEAVATAPLSPSAPEVATMAQEAEETDIEHSPLYLAGRCQNVPLLPRRRLRPGETLAGPLIVAEPTSTLVVEPGWQARVLVGGEIVLERTVSSARARPAGREPDPVLLEIMNRRFMAIAEEMGIALAHTAHSVNIRERLDFSCAIFNRHGELIANAPHIPVHLGSMGDSVGAVRERFAASMRPGDVFLVNSPYHGGTHLPDITVVTPVWDRARHEVLFYVASRGHHADVGGITPGSMPPGSRSITEEGVLSEGLLIVRDGRFLDAEVRAWLASGPYPARHPAQNILDLKAQIAANEKGAQALLELTAARGLTTVEAYMEHALNLGEAAVREVIGKLSDGEFTCPLDNGGKIHVAVRIDRARGCAVIDFTGTSPQQPDNFNAPAAVCRAVVLYVFRTLVARDIPLNAGCLRPLDIRIPAGSLLNPRPPAAVVAGNVETSQAVADALYGALNILAASQGTMNNLTFGDATRQYYETIAGGAGAGRDFDGADAVHTHMTNSRITDPEVLETRFPVLLERFAIRRGSGGAGRRRGGDGVIRRIRFLAPMTAAILSSRRRVAPFGLAQGLPGLPGQNRLIRRDGSVLDLGGCATLTVEAGDVLEIATPGGGGYGPPEITASGR